MNQIYSLQHTNKPAESLNRYINRLKGFEKRGKIILSATLSLVIGILLFLLFKKPGYVVSIYNLILLFVFFSFCFFVCIWLFLWKPKKLEFKVFTAAITIQKQGNSFVTPYGRLLVPYPWLGLIKENATEFCLLGQWNGFSLTHNGVYLLGIPELGFDIEKHKDKGFFKYKGMPTFLFFSVSLLITGLIYLIFTNKTIYFKKEIGDFAVIIERVSCAISVASCLFVLFFVK